MMIDEQAEMKFNTGTETLELGNPGKYVYEVWLIFYRYLPCKVNNKNGVTDIANIAKPLRLVKYGVCG